MKRSRLLSTVGLMFVVCSLAAQEKPVDACSQPRAKYGVSLVNVGNHKLFLNCSGSGSSLTVILEAGTGDSSEVWISVQKLVEKFARVCSYDRAGLGKSDRLPHPETATDIVEDLHQLLHKAGIAAPCVLVGHSIGGIYVRNYEARYPEEVKGLVLVDSAHEEQLSRVSAISPEWAQRVASRFPHDPEELRRQGMLPANERLTWHADIPLIVIEHEVVPHDGAAQKMTNQSEAVFHSLQEDLAKRSNYGELRKADRSGHYIQRDQPELVTQAIRDVIRQSEALAASKPLQ